MAHHLLFLTEWFFKPLRKLFQFTKNILNNYLLKKYQTLKSTEIKIVQNLSNPNRWEQLEQNGRNFIFITLNWHITNAGRFNVTVLNPYLLKPIRIAGSIMIKDVKSVYWGRYSIPKYYTTEATTNFLIDSNSKYSSNDFTVDVSFEDQFGQKFDVKNIKVSSLKKSLPIKEKEFKKEIISKIMNQNVKKIISILRNEIEQYKNNGRRVGGLGSVKSVANLTEYHSEGEIREFIYNNSSKENVKSINVDAIIKLFKSSTETQKRIIISSLSQRINKNSEYLNVAYLILFALFELKKFSQGLIIARKKLYGDNKNGFSDVLRMIDTLLRFRHSEFSDKDLQDIEKLIDSVSESTFEIPQRINSIRIKRIV